MLKEVIRREKDALEELLNVAEEKGKKNERRKKK